MALNDSNGNAGSRPSGQDEVREALINAGLELVAEQGLQFSVRDVADRAQVNHGLVHRYFGSKSGLISEVLDEFNANSLANLDEDGRPGDDLWTDLPDIAVVLARIALEAEGDPFDRHPVFQSWIRSMQDDAGEEPMDAAEAKARVAAAASMALGWGLFQRVISFGVGATEDDEQALEATVRRLFVEIGGGSLTV